MTDPTPILTDASAIRQRMHEKSISAIASTFPLTLRNGTLEVQDLKVVSRQFSPIDQYNALMREGTLQEAVKGTLILKDKEGKVPMPTLYDISDSAAWFNKSDVGVIVHREDGLTKVRVAKAKYHDRIGMPGTVLLSFDKWTGRYDGAAV